MPNGEDKKNNFVLRVLDPKTKTYRPAYIAPDATDKVQGDVRLSDATDGTQNAATGITAATPAAVKAANDNANTKLSRTDSAAQTVLSEVTFSNKVIASKGIELPAGESFTGSLKGNADTATRLATARNISVRVGAADAGIASFNGGADATITIPQVDASKVTLGTLPLSVIPQGALDRLIKVQNKAARFALTNTQVQLGDSVLQVDTGVMYIVVDESKLSSEAGYQEYKAGTSLSTPWAGVTDKPATFTPSAHTHPFGELTGTIQMAQIVDGSLTAAKMGFNYAGSSSKGGAATSAVKLANARKLSFAGAINANVTFDGTQDVSINTTLGAGSVTETAIADDAVTGAKLSNNSVQTVHLVNGSVTAAKLGASAVTTEKVADGAITSAKLAKQSVGFENLAPEVGVVYVGSDEPTADVVKIWVKI